MDISSMTPLPQTQKLTLRGKDIFQFPPGAPAARAKYESTFYPDALPRHDIETWERLHLVSKARPGSGQFHYGPHTREDGYQDCSPRKKT